MMHVNFHYLAFLKSVCILNALCQMSLYQNYEYMRHILMKQCEVKGFIYLCILQPPLQMKISQTQAELCTDKLKFKIQKLTLHLATFASVLSHFLTGLTMEVSER